LATGHTPPGASLWSKGAPHLRPHRGGGPSPTGHLWPPPPPLAREGGRPPVGKEGHSPHWPPTGHKGTGRGRLRPALPPLATYALTPTPADRGLRTGGLPTPRLTHWPPRHSPTPQTFGERWPKGRGGVFACKGGRYDVARVAYTPFGDPLPTD